MMKSTRGTRALVVAAVAVALGACSPDSHRPDDGGPIGDGGDGGITCAEAGLPDDDGDGIANVHEGSGMVDTDRDGTPDSRDNDSDDDGIPDSEEAGGPDRRCSDEPEDADADDTPNFQDVDSDGNGIRDRDETTGDTDEDGIPDYRDTDDDADGLNDLLEVGPDPVDPADSDGDGIPDYHDRDSDNDGIPDIQEGPGDVDRDGLQNFRDIDSDGDDIPDAEEGTEDCDDDGLGNYVDRDSDNDGVSDAMERENRTDPCLVDTDGDGLTDLVEQAIGTDPTDAGSAIGEDEFFVILPFQDPALVDEMDFETNIKQADVYFLIDTTGSMGGELMNIRNSLSTFIVPEVADRIRDVEFGLGHFDDIPTGSFGSMGDEAYEHIHDISGDIASIQSAIDTFPTGSGADWEESDVVALYCTATGEGVSTWVDPSPGCLESRFGYPCFRPYSLPIILLFTDAPMHNGPPDGTSAPYGLPDVVNWLDAIAVLNDIGAKVLGFSSEEGSYNDLVATSMATGAVVPVHSFDGTEARMSGVCDDDECCTGINGAGQATNEDGDCPLVWRLDYNGSGLGNAVVEAIEDLSTQIARDVNTTVEERPVIDDGVDAADFITSVVPLRSTPTVGVDHFDDSTFFGVQPGTILTFQVTFQNDIVPEELEPQVFVARIVVLGDNTVRLDDRRVIILIPPSGIPIG